MWITLFFNRILQTQVFHNGVLISSPTFASSLPSSLFNWFLENMGHLLMSYGHVKVFVGWKFEAFDWRAHILFPLVDIFKRHKGSFLIWKPRRTLTLPKGKWFSWTFNDLSDVIVGCWVQFLMFGFWAKNPLFISSFHNNVYLGFHFLLFKMLLFVCLSKGHSNMKTVYRVLWCILTNCRLVREAGCSDGIDSKKKSLNSIHRRLITIDTQCRYWRAIFTDTLKLHPEHWTIK